ncbi:hypothetical protein T03_4939 [Trichinella britovi]|uniref:Uncharacterized protein n=1 Tax=Trichinella britovi TaxID=45882 RepID=A0A0V0Z2P2_TRIBR|nr:hypothetical protein T03_4939 [Trichinella britovi]
MQFTFDVADASTEVNKPYARKSSGRVSVTANTETSRRRSALCQMQHSSLFDTTKKLFSDLS